MERPFPIEVDTTTERRRRLATHTTVADDSVLWRVVMLTPSGHVDVVEVRTPSEQLALDMVRAWKPYHEVAMDPLGNAPISGGPEGHLGEMRSGQGEETTRARMASAIS